MELLKTGAYLVNGTEIIEDTPEAQARLQAVAGPDAPSKEEAAKGTIAYGILEAKTVFYLSLLFFLSLFPSVFQ